MENTLGDPSSLLIYNQMGLIPGPHETEEEFFNRAEYCLKFKDLLAEDQKSGLELIDKPLCKEILQEASKKSAELYGIAPTWVPVVFSNENLALWHGGCAWIFQMEAIPTTALLQLRKKFAFSTKLLGIYDRSEVVVHELSHVGRMAFEEPKFEEILAYRSSTSAFRRYFGPMIQSAWESLVFLMALAFSVIVDFYITVSEKNDPLHLVTLIKMIPLLFLGLGLIRLWIRQRTFEACYKMLAKGFQSEALANAVIYRLTDKEIERFAKSSFVEMQGYAKENRGELRWRAILDFVK